MEQRVGIDLTEICRIEKIVTEQPAFLTKVFTENERDEFNKKGKGIYQSVAGSFCVKEAFSKALGSGFSAFYLKRGKKSGSYLWTLHRENVCDESMEKFLCLPRSIEVLHDGFGRPYVRLKGDLEKLESSLEIQVSITHTDTTAGAVVLLTLL